MCGTDIREKRRAAGRIGPLWRSVAAVPFLAASAVGAAEPARAAAPGIDSGHVVQLVVGLFIVVVAIILLAWLVRRVPGMSMGGRGVGGLHVVTGIALGARERLVVVQVGGQQILVGLSQAGMNTLHVLDKPLGDDDAGRKQPEPGFAERLNSMMKKSVSAEVGGPGRGR